MAGHVQEEHWAQEQARAYRAKGVLNKRDGRRLTRGKRPQWRIDSENHRHQSSFQRRRDDVAAQFAQLQHHLQIEAERELSPHRRDRLAAAIESARLELGSLEAQLAAIEHAVTSR
jgi:hypothetical protein